jgi:hypothetical protein
MLLAALAAHRSCVGWECHACACLAVIHLRVQVLSVKQQLAERAAEHQRISEQLEAAQQQLAVALAAHEETKVRCCYCGSGLVAHVLVAHVLVDVADVSAAPPLLYGHKWPHDA